MKNQISIHIGEFFVSPEPAIIYTLLGSCVAVCLFDPLQRIGGMNHILLPGKAVAKTDTLTSRYARNAIEILINSVLGLGGGRRRLIAKAFGGAHLLPSISESRGIGRHLAEFVMDLLKTEHIRIASYDLGGTDIRKIYFHTDTGEVFLKRSPMKEFSNFIDKEQHTVREIYQKISKSETLYPVFSK